MIPVNQQEQIIKKWVYVKGIYLDLKQIHAILKGCN